jgi:hypothetical protein
MGVVFEGALEQEPSYKDDDHRVILQELLPT